MLEKFFRKVTGHQTREDIRESREKMIGTHETFRNKAEKVKDAILVSQLYEEHKIEKKLRNSDHPVLIDRFPAKEEFDSIIREYDELCSRSITFNFDTFPAKEVSHVRNRLDQIEQEHGDELRAYLAPYTAVPEVQGAEDHFRWSANKSLRLPTTKVQPHGL